MIRDLMRRRPFLWMVLAWIVMEIPFLPSAFRVDDPNILAIAKQIFHSPLDPYGFHINWLGTPAPGFDVLANPPLVSGWLATWHLLFPWNEISFHIAMIPFSLLAMHAFGVLANFFRVDRWLAIVLLCCSPAFFLGSQVVMPDVAMLSLFLLALAYAALYEEQGYQSQSFIAFLAGFLCPLTKYNGIVVFPLLLWLFVRSQRKRGMAAVALAPAISLLLWNVLTSIKYGRMHFLAMAAFEQEMG